MKAPTVLALGLWILVVGGNIIQTQTLPSQTFMDAPRLPWLIVFLPITVVVGALTKRGHPGQAQLEPWVDRRFGEGTYSDFMEVLRLELLFAAMCLGIVISALARAFFFGTTIMPPEILGFFASGGVAFLAAHFIRRSRGNG